MSGANDSLVETLDALRAGSEGVMSRDGSAAEDRQLSLFDRPQRATPPTPKAAFDPIAEARANFHDAVRSGERVVCPCCERDGRLYNRRLDADMARVLIRLFKLGGDVDPVHVGDLFPGTKAARGGGGWSRARLWGLIEACDVRTVAENSRGFWRLTRLGVAFVQGDITQPRAVTVWDNQPLCFSEERITVREALGDPFVYTEMMAPHALPDMTGPTP